MRIIIFFLLISFSATANGQSLKDALYGGKLKTDSGTVIKKGDDLSSKIDTSRKVELITQKSKQTIVSIDSSAKKDGAPTDSVAAVGTVNVTLDNNKIWKEFIDASINTFNTEVMTSKKIKKGVYYIIVDYAIEMDGKVTINNVYPSPENKFLEEQVKERLSIDTPKLNPILSGTGKPRKVMKRHNLTLTKE